MVGYPCGRSPGASAATGATAWARGATGPLRGALHAEMLQGLFRGSEQPLIDAEEDRERLCRRR